MKLRPILYVLILLPSFLYSAVPSYITAAAGDEFGNAKKDAPERVLKASSYSTARMEDMTVLPDGTVVTGENGYIEYSITVAQDVLYTISLRYKPVTGSSGKILRAVSINGKTPFKEAGEMVFPRFYRDADTQYKNIQGNQPFPSQVEVYDWFDAPCKDQLGYMTEPFTFLFKQGANTLRFSSRGGSMILDTITLSPPPAALPAYKDYINTAQTNGAAAVSAAPVKIQAEDAVLKSSPSFYPINDRTSPLSEPYHPSNIVLNCIGGTPWKESGERIDWEVTVPESGLYRIGFRFKQNTLRGLYAARLLRINGEVPFKEAADIRFFYDSRFQFSYLGETAKNSAAENDGAYWFYLRKGVNRIGLENTLGELGPVLYRMEDIIIKLNGIYRTIIAITGTAPDKYRDYQLSVRIPHLRTELELLYTEAQRIHTDLLALYGKLNGRTASIARLLVVMNSFKDNNDDQIVRRLGAFKECITALGKSVIDLREQPLKLDYAVFAGTQSPKIRADGNAFQYAYHNIRAFIGSFFNDYNVGSNAVSSGKTLDVWLSTGRDQFEVIRRLVNESFETQNGVHIRLKLISPDVILASTLSGIGPDVVIQITNTAPVNFAFRGAAYDLTLFDDFEKVSQAFLPAALTSFRYNGGCFALPDKMSFPVLYYRKDILDALHLKVPQTWDELLNLIPPLQRSNMEIYLDTDPPGFLGAAMSMGAGKTINTIFLSRLYQTGSDIYTKDETRCSLDTDEAYKAFTWWTQFYTRHSFPTVVDFITRFRLGEVPIGVVDLSAYTTLSVSAPEIRGLWEIAPVPGTVQKDGSVRYDIPCVTGAAMIIKNSAELHGTVNESWEFLKWWTGNETQTKFAREMEAVLGPAGRYTTANLESFKNIPWSYETKQTLYTALSSLHGIPQIPGGYITGRYLNNAFRTVIAKYENPVDILFENCNLINEEIAVKRAEFDLE